MRFRQRFRLPNPVEEKAAGNPAAEAVEDVTSVAAKLGFR